MEATHLPKADTVRLVAPARWGYLRAPQWCPSGRSGLFSFAQPPIFLRCILRTFNIMGVMMNRSSKAPLSPSELTSLRRVRGHSKRQISATHRQLLLSMGLVVANGDELILTDAGRQRLAHEGRTDPLGSGPESHQPPPADVWIRWR
jgi:hypothetical protein